MTGPRAVASALALAISLCASLGRADPDEAWVSRAALAPDVWPLLVLLVDTSESMARTLDVPAPYDPARSYDGGCSADRVYWRRGPGVAPDCDGQHWVSAAAADDDAGWRCAAGAGALSRTGVYVASRAAQWEARPGGGYWRELRAGDGGAVECRADRGSHGGQPGSWFAVEADDAPWGPDSSREVRWDAPPLSDAYVFFSGNYLNYLAQALPLERATLYQWLARQVASATMSVHELHLALARLSHDGGPDDLAGEGGMIVLADAPLPAVAGRAAGLLTAWQPAGPAPLGEALTEVAAWLSGQAVGYGLDSSAAPGEPLPSSPDSRDAADSQQYRSPYSHACRPVTLGLMTAAAPSADDGAAAAAARLPGFGSAGCAAGCLAELARWLVDTDLLPSVPGHQFAELRLLAPLPAADPAAVTARAARTELIDLRDPLALVMLVAHALQHDAAGGVRAPVRVSQPAYLPQDAAVFFSLSDPRYRARWPGNLRRYRLVAADSAIAGPTVVDRHGEPAFDSRTGQPVAGTSSQWSDMPDGAATTDGGAAARLPQPAERTIYSDLSDGPLTADANRIAPGNPSLSRELFGLSPQDRRTQTELVDWLLGRDVFDQDHDGDTAVARLDLADPGLHRPALLHHADGSSTVYIATSDGMLHAVDAASGEERWAFVPQPMLGQLADLAAGRATASRTHGLDGRVVASVLDVNRDGVIDASLGESAQLFVGFGRQGSGYYALDVSRPGRPEILWSVSKASLPAHAQSWPEPVVARMHIDPARQSAGRRVIVLAGGYDPAERVGAGARAEPGAALTVLDAETGELLWMAAGQDSSSVDLSPEAMRYSLASAPRVIDRDGDGFADLMYAVDLGGQLWRVDALPGSTGTAAISLLMIADLGNRSDSAPRRFFHTPDVAYEPLDGRNRLVIAFGSGRLSRPRETGTEDRIYAVFDDVAGPDPAQPPVTDADLDDVTDISAVVAAGSRGWKRRLDAHGPGEKVAGVASTFDHRLRFTTHRPLPQSAAAPCGPPAAQNRLYTLDVRTGRAWRVLGDEELPSDELPADGLPPGLRIVFPGDAGSPCSTPDCGAPVLMSGGLASRIDFRNRPVKTSWRQLDAPAE